MIHFKKKRAHINSIGTSRFNRVPSVNFSTFLIALTKIGIE